MADLIQLRRDTAANWSGSNPKLALGEVGLILSGTVMTDPIQFKVGNGTSFWNSLPLQVAGVSGSATTGHFPVMDSLGHIVDSIYGTGSFATTASFVDVSSSLDTRITNVSSSISTSLDTRVKSVSSSLGVVSGSLKTLGSDVTTLSGSVSQSLTSLSSSKASIDGYYETLSVGQADTLDGSVGRVEDTWIPIIRTTAGDLDILSDEPAYVLSVHGATRMSDLTPMTLTGIRFNGFNALDPTQKITGTLSGTTIQSSTNVIAYFRCVKGTWGTYGQSTENNGYLFTDSNGNKVVPVNVKECTTVPVVGSSVSTVSTQVYGGYTYYLPATSGDYLCAEFASSVVLSNICAHIAWSNKDDDKFVTRSSSLLDLTSIVNAVGNGGLHGITAGSTSVADEIVFNDAHTQATWYKRLGKVLLSSLTWASSSTTVTVSGSTSTTYTYTAGLTNANYSGLFTSSLAGLSYSSSKLSFSSTTVTPDSWSSAISGKNILYTLATSGSGTVSIVSSLTCNDMGTEEVLGTNTISGLGLIRTSYEGGLTDYLRGLRSDISKDTKVIAQSLTEQYEEIQNLKSIVGSLTAFLTRGMIEGQNIFLEASGSPSTAVGIPVQPWLFYRDLAASPKTVWVSTGNVATTDWIQLG